MNALVQHWPLVIGASLALAIGVWLLARRPGPDARLALDARDPARRWVQNAFMLVTGEHDYAHLPGGEARRILAHWWDVYGPLEHRRVLASLGEDAGRDHAWGLLRFIVVSRLGVAAGLCSDEVSWADVLPVARRLQAAYPGWRAMAHAYVRARRQWKSLPLDGTADDASMQQILENLARLDDTRWAELPWETPLLSTDPEHHHG